MLFRSDHSSSVGVVVAAVSVVDEVDELWQRPQVHTFDPFDRAKQTVNAVNDKPWSGSAVTKAIAGVVRRINFTLFERCQSYCEMQVLRM